MTTQSDTPRTDSALSRADIAPDYGLSAAPISGWQLSEIIPLTRDLERENARLRDALSEMLAELDTREPPQGHIFKDTGGMLLARAALDSGPWCYESDGERGARTHYAVRDSASEPCGVERVEFKSAKAARKFARFVNALILIDGGRP